MEYIFIAREGDKAAVVEYKERFDKKTSQELIDDYNKQAKLGIVGVHQQALCLIGMAYSFKKRFADSPIYLTDGTVLGMKGIIRLNGEKFEYI